TTHCLRTWMVDVGDRIFCVFSNFRVRFHFFTRITDLDLALMMTDEKGKEATYSLLANFISLNRYTNPRGIPRAPFVDKVEEYVTSPEDINGTLRRFDEMLS